MTAKVELPSEISLFSGTPTPAFQDEVLEYRMVRYEQNSSVTNDTQYTCTSTDESAFYHLPGALVSVDFRVTQSDGTAVELSDQGALCSNGWSLFETARLRIGGNEISQVLKPGKACHMKNMVEKGKEWLETMGPNQHVYVDSVSDSCTGVTGFLTAHVASAAAPVAQLLPVNSFYHEVTADKLQLGTTGFGITRVQANSKFDPSFKAKVDRALLAADSASNERIFLSLIDVFPILASMDKVVRGVRLEVALDKIANVAEALFSFTTDLKIVIDRVALHVPILRGSLSALARMEKELSPYTVYGENLYLRTIVDSGFASAGEKVHLIDSRSSKPKRVYVAFGKSTRNTNTHLNPLEFDLPESKTNLITRIELRANGKSVPSQAYDATKDKYRILQDLYKVAYKQHDYSDSCVITADNWAKMHSIFAFDLEQTESSAYESRGNVDLQLSYTLSAGAGSAYTVYSLVVSELQATIDNTSGMTKLRTV